MFSAYLDTYRDDLPENLKNRMTFMKQLMQQDISNVQDASQLQRWVNLMFHNILEVQTLLSITPGINLHFGYEQKTLFITDVALSISDEIESMIGRHKTIDIRDLHRSFSVDTPQNASLAQLLVAFHKLNETQ